MEGTSRLLGREGKLQPGIFQNPLPGVCAGSFQHSEAFVWLLEQLGLGDERAVGPSDVASQRVCAFLGIADQALRTCPNTADP